VNAAVEGDWANDEEIELPKDLPQPTLWRVLVVPVQPRRMSRGGIALPSQASDAEGYLNYIGRIAALGPLAGKNEKFRVPGSALEQYAWDFQVGDWVVYGRYAGQRMEKQGVKLVLVNDDEILAKVQGPEGYRIYV
jgi:co-chaperonin GroES (HSP10)